MPLVATVITEVCGGIALMVWVTRAMGAAVDLSPVPRVAVATAGMVAVLWAALALPLLVTILAGVAAYAVLALSAGRRLSGRPGAAEPRGPHAR